MRDGPTSPAGDVTATGVVQVAILSRRGLVRAGLRSLLEGPDVRTTTALLPGVSPDVVVIDAVGEDGRLLPELPFVLALAGVPVVVLAPYDVDCLDVIADEDWTVGAWRVLALDTSRQELRSTVTDARVVGPTGTRTDGVSFVLGLSTRQRDVATRLARSMTNQEIADDLGLGVNTVKTYLQTLYRKIGVVNRTQATLWVVEHGLQHRAEHPVWEPAEGGRAT